MTQAQLDPSEWVWDTDIESATTAVHLNRAKDQDHYLRTVGLVEQGIDPVTGEKLTMSGLKRWVSRCVTPPSYLLETRTDEPLHRTRTITPSGKHVQNPPA